MYTIRTYTPDGVETNRDLGSTYQVFEFHKLTESAFKAAFKDVFKEDFNPDSHNTRAIVIGDTITCLPKGDVAYVMSENGKTFSTVKAIDSAAPDEVKTLDEADLVSFGNYLLSQSRKESVSKHNRDAVHDADLCNWREIIGK